MSNVVDNRVVEMQFDNRNFEKNVQTSISTLDKLKQSLNLKGASKGLENVNDAAEKNKMGVLGSAVETVQAKFSALQVIGITALSNITTAVMNTGAQMAKSLTLDPIIQGFQEYETQMGSIQTILANTKSKGSTLGDVTNALDQLNEYADQTIYNFTEMTRNIGTFTAAGVDLDKSVTSIKGIANLAAISGSTSAQASSAMYQLSQALATGKVSLMDWNSVVNAGMGGEVFQTALKRTAKQMGHDVDGMIEKYGSFRDSLTEGQWLTAEVLTETLTQLSGAYTEADLIAQGYTEEQAREIVELSKTAIGAATEVKTFTQLMETTKEAIGSGWAKTWQIIFGDFEEAKELFTGISNVVSGFVNKMSDARNTMLQEWKDLGGRTALLESFKNIFEGIGSVIKPIAEAFGEVFEPLKGETLANACKSLQEFTSHLKLSDETAANLKATFKGVFSVIEIAMNVIGAIGKGVFDVISSVVSALTGFSGGLLGITGAIGTWLSNIAAAIDETDFFGKVVEKVTGFITGIIDGIKNFGKALSESASNINPFESVVTFFESLLDVVSQIGSAIYDAFTNIGNGVDSAMSSNGLMELINGGIFAAVLIGIKKFIDGMSDAVDGVGGIFEGVTDILDEVKGCFTAYQNDLNSNALLKLAGAIGILALSLTLIASIDADGMDRAIVGMTVLFGELVGAMALFAKIDLGLFGVTKSVMAMMALSTAILILSASLKVISSLDWQGLAKGLIGVGALMAEIGLFLQFAKFGGKVASTAVGIVILSSALLILSKAVENFAGMDWSSIGRGLTAIGGLLLELALFTNLTGNASHVVSTGISIALLAGAMKILASAMQDFAGMDLNSIGRGLIGMGGALAAIGVAMRLMPKGMVGYGAGLLAVAGSLIVICEALSRFAAFSWDSIAHGFVALGGSLGILAVGLRLMTGSLPGSAALIVAAGALAILAPVLTTLGGMSWEGIAKGLVALAGAFAVLGVAGMLLGGMIPVLLGLSAAMGIFGAAMLGLGAGIALIGVGFTAIATAIGSLGASLGVAAGAIVAGLTAIVSGLGNLIPMIAEKLAQGFVAFASLLSQAAPQLVNALLEFILAAVEALAAYAPSIADGMLTLFINVVNVLAGRSGELVGAFVEFLANAINGLASKMPMLVGSFINLFSSIFIGAISGLSSAIASMVEPLVTMLINLFSKVVEAIAPFLPTITNMFSGIIEAVGNVLIGIMTVIAPYLPVIIAGVTAIADAFARVVEAIAPTVPAICGLISTIVQTISGFVLGVGGLIVQIIQIISDAIVGIIQILAPYIPVITSMITTVVTVIANAVVQIIQTIAPFIPSISQLVWAISSAVTSICNAFITLVNQLAPIIDSITGLVKQLGDSISQVLQSICDIISTSADSISQVLSSLSDTFDTVFNGIAGVIESVGSSIKSVLDGISGVIESIGQAALDAGTGFENLAKGVETITNLGLADMAVSLAAVAAGVGDIASHSGGLSEVSGSMQSLIGSIAAASATFGMLIMAVTLLNTALSMIGTTASTAISMLSTSITSASTCFSSLTTAAASAALGIQSAIATMNASIASFSLGNLVGIIQNGASQVSASVYSMVLSVSVALSGMSSLFTAAGFAMMSALNVAFSSGCATSIVILTASTLSMVSVLISTVGAFASASNSMMSAMINAFMSGSNSLRAIISALMLSLLTIIKSKAGEFNDAGVKLVNAFINGIESGQGPARNAVTNMMTSVVSALDGYYGSFYDAGAYVASGFAAGIESGSFAAAIKARAMANAAEKAAKDALDEHSPSKVFMKIGKYVPEGFAIGIDAMRGVVENSTIKMADTAINNTKTAISRVGDAMSSDLDVEPTIRPVVDMSTMETDIGRLNVGADVSALLSKPVDSLSQIMNDTQAKIEASNREVINAVNGLREDLNGYYSTDGSEVALYVDSKKLASSLAKPMNHQLNLLSTSGF